MGIFEGSGVVWPEDREVFERLPNDGGSRSVQRALESRIRASKWKLSVGRQI